MNLIAGEWRDGGGEPMQRRSPVDETTVWTGRAANEADVEAALDAARAALRGWRERSPDERIGIAEAFADAVAADAAALAAAISRETGKPAWEAATEVTSVRGKVALSVTAQQQRAGESWREDGALRQHLAHRAHGVMAVFGPYNFPCHLPNGHIVPALLAGNTVVFKPSEMTPGSAEHMARLWQRAGLPAGVLNLLQGGAGTGRALAAGPIDGLLFTGSAATGCRLHRQLAGRPQVQLALEMGGNNPLIVHPDAAPDAAAPLILQSAFISAGQRCTCARRLLLVEGEAGERQLEAVLAGMARIRVAVPDAQPEPFMGPLISGPAAQGLRDAEAALCAAGARSLRPLQGLDLGPAWLRPGLIDVSAVPDLPDEEYFGPLLQVQRYRDFDHALELAAHTRFGLAAGLLGGGADDYARLRARVPAGIINWNRPLTGASSALPFGGVGLSGNHRPSAYYAADYCAYPVSSLEQDRLEGDWSGLRGIAEDRG